MPTKRKELWLIEYYRKHPTTGEPGWDIHFAWVNNASTREEAINKVKKEDPRFDVVITCNRQAEMFALAMQESPLWLI